MPQPEPSFKPTYETGESLDSQSSEATLAYLQSPDAIRDRCRILYDLGCQDHLDSFRVERSRLPAVVDIVLQEIQQNYSSLNVPFHSRWRHFEVAGVSRLTLLQPLLAALNPVARAQLLFDLVIVSVLLDAGAGDRWCYREPGSGQEFRRSEGLAIASFHSFCQGVFSSDPHQPLQADAQGLQSLTVTDLATAFQVTDANPLLGLEGRVALLNRLGAIVAHHPAFSSAEDAADPRRPGNLVHPLLTQAPNHHLSAVTVLSAVLQSLGDIWPGRLSLNGTNLGDIWPHPKLPQTTPTSPLVPFHKLSQWLTYSLLEPLQDLGLTITDLDRLTGLAEYRNGGLCLDGGLFELKDANLFNQPHRPDSPLIVEWRALTVIALEAIATQVRDRLHLSATEFPLVKVLQGGTWSAGRRLAAHKRPGGSPPLQIESDGTVF